MYLLAICISSLEKNICSEICQFLIKLFVFWQLSYMNSLYILDIRSLSDIYFANIFSHSVGCFFILLMVSFAVQKFLV